MPGWKIPGVAMVKVYIHSNGEIRTLEEVGNEPKETKHQFSKKTENWKVWRKWGEGKCKNGPDARKLNKSKKLNSSLVYLIYHVQHD